MARSISVAQLREQVAQKIQTLSKLVTETQNQLSELKKQQDALSNLGDLHFSIPRQPRTPKAPVEGAPAVKRRRGRPPKNK